MRSIHLFTHLMSSTVTVAPRSSVDGYGKPVFGTAVSYRAHLARKRQMVRTETGQEVISNQAVYLATAANIEPSSQITLSTGDVGSTDATAIHPPIMAVERRFDGAGPHHVVLYLG